MFLRRVAVPLIATLFFPPMVWAVNFDVTITVDNAYAFGFGDVNGIHSATDWFGGVSNTGSNGACLILCASGPEHYTVNSAQNDYIYISAWPDDLTDQGVLAGFAQQSTLLSSFGAWEVFATGDTTSPSSAAFDRATVNNQIALANVGTGSSPGSQRWVNENGVDQNNVAGIGTLVRDTNNTLYLDGNPFANPQTGGVAGQFATDDRWMWWDNGLTANAFDYTPDGDGGWVIFRAALGEVQSVPEPSGFLFLGLCLSVGAFRGWASKRTAVVREEASQRR